MKKLLLKSMLLLCALVAGSGSAWADTTYSMTIDNNASGDNNVHWTSTSQSSLSYNDVTWSTSVSGTSYVGTTKSYAQIGKKDEPATAITISTTAFAGKEIVSASLTGYCSSNTGPTLTITAGSTTMLSSTPLVKTTSTTYTTTNNNITLSSGQALTFSFSSSAKAGICISAINVVYKEADARTAVVTIGNLTDADFDIGESGTLEAGITPATGLSASDYTLEWTEVDNDVLTLLDDGSFLAGLTEGTQAVTLTVTPENTTDYKPVNKTFTISVTDPAWINYTKKGYTNSDAVTEETGINGTVTLAKASGSTAPAWYDSGEAVRIYSDNTITATAKSGNVITSININVTSGSMVVGNFNKAGTLTKSGSCYLFTLTVPAREVIYTTASNFRIDKIKPNIASNFTQTVSSNGWATFATDAPVTFDAGTAYVVSAVNTSAGTTTLTEVTSVPASTPVLLKGAGSKTISVIPSASAPASNLLEICNGTAAPTGYNYFVLAKDGDDACFKQWTGTAASLKGKVVLPLELDLSGSSARNLRIVFENDTDGITNNIREATTHNRFFNLQGVEVAQPTKGLYIINGKKILVK